MRLISTIFHRLIGFMCIGMLIGAPLYAQQTVLYVFYPSVIRPQILQKKLSDELPGVTVVVFGRYIDFAEGVKTSAPDAILTKPNAINQFGSYSLTISGVNNGSVDESYVLVSEEEKMPSKQAEPSTIGVVDFLGSHGMDSLTRNLFDTPPRINRVSKIEDLLPMLTFNIADAVLVSAKNADYLARISNIQFLRSEINGAKIGIIALGVKNDNSAKKIVALIRRLSKETCILFDVENWR